MRAIWLLLTPSEVERVCRPLGGDGEHADLLRTLCGRLNRITGELTLSGAEWVRVRAAVRNWRLGGEQQFKALEAAFLRSPDYDGW